MTLISDELREWVAQLANDHCEYCRLPQSSQVATFPVDHIVPVVLRGPAKAENLCLACPRCNALKWTHIEARDPASGEVVPLFNSRTDDWTAHFRWSISDPSILEALTTTGRATIALLDLNSSRRIAIRRLLVLMEMHPPT